MKIYLGGSDITALELATEKQMGLLISFIELRPGGRSLKVWKTIITEKKNDEHDGERA